MSQNGSVLQVISDRPKFSAQALVEHFERLDEITDDYSTLSLDSVHWLHPKEVKIIANQVEPELSMDKNFLHAKFIYQGIEFYRPFFINRLVPSDVQDVITPQEAWRIVKEKSFNP